jgi:hypothetical protein
VLVEDPKCRVHLRPLFRFTSQSSLTFRLQPPAGGLPPDSVCEEEPEVLRDMERLIHEFHDNDKCAAHMLSLTACCALLCAPGYASCRRDGVR